MGFGIKEKKNAIVIGLLILFIAAFTLFHGLFGTISAPFAGIEETGPGDDEFTAQTETAEPPEKPGDPEPLSATLIQDDFITVKMNESDVSKGGLILVNRDHSYEIPDDNGNVSVADVKTQSYRVEDENIVLDASIIEALNEMMDAFYADTGRDNITIISGFRDKTKQQEILDDYVKLVGPVEALKWASPPGYSEHHTGLAIDLGIFSSGTVRTFTGTGINTWFKENACKFGFILRYTGEKTEITGTAEEPWHFRYVGNPHAYLIYQNGWCLEEYIEFVMKYSYDEPYKVQYENNTYEIYYTAGTEFRIPFDCEFDFSGNNIDGFIITIVRE